MVLPVHHGDASRKVVKLSFEAFCTTHVLLVGVDKG